MTVARRIAELFVAPAGGERSPERERQPVVGERPAACDRSAAAGDGSAARAPAAVAVLAPPADAAALAAALGLALARSHRAAVAVVCVWSADGPLRHAWRAPARPAAARLAAWLAGRGHDAHGAGRLVVVRLAEAGDDAAGEALRVGAAAGPVPTLLALAGPRSAAFDVALAAQDLVVVGVPPAADPALAELAVAGLARALVCPLPPADPARALAAAGVVLLPSVRRALAAPIAVLS